MSYRRERLGRQLGKLLVPVGRGLGSLLKRIFGLGSRGAKKMSGRRHKRAASRSRESSRSRSRRRGGVAAAGDYEMKDAGPIEANLFGDGVAVNQTDARALRLGTQQYRGCGGPGVAAMSNSASYTKPSTSGRVKWSQLAHASKGVIHVGGKRKKATSVKEWVRGLVKEGACWQSSPLMMVGTKFSSFTDFANGYPAASFNINKGSYLRRSDTTQFCVLPCYAATGVDGGCAPNCYVNTGATYFRNGMFAQPVRQDATPGLRESDNPLIGKLRLDLSCQLQGFRNTPVLNLHAFDPIHALDVQVHLVAFDSFTLQALNLEPSAASASFATLLDAADFELAVGYEAYVRSLIRDQAVSGYNNSILATELDFYPAKRAYRIRWSSPVMHCDVTAPGQQVVDESAAGEYVKSYGPARVDLSNISIDIGREIDYQAGGAATLDVSAGIIGIKYNVYHLVVTWKSSKASSVYLPYSTNGALFTPATGNSVMGVDCIHGQGAYTFSFKDQ